MFASIYRWLKRIHALVYNFDGHSLQEHLTKFCYIHHVIFFDNATTLRKQIFMSSISKIIVTRKVHQVRQKMKQTIYIVL